MNGYTHLMSGRPLHAARPRHFFRNPGPMPERVTLRLTIPAELGVEGDVLAEVRAQVEAVERDVGRQRRETGARVFGRRRVLEQSWRESPTSIEPRRNLRPRFAASTPVARITALLGLRQFLAAYRDARARWLVGVRAEFPAGTYWLRRMMAVPITPT